MMRHINLYYHCNSESRTSKGNRILHSQRTFISTHLQGIFLVAFYILGRCAHYLPIVILDEKLLIEFYSANFKPSNNAFIYSERQNYSIVYTTGDNPHFNQS